MGRLNNILILPKASQKHVFRSKSFDKHQLVLSSPAPRGRVGTPEASRKEQAHRTMIRAQHIIVDGNIAHSRGEILRDQEVVEAPTDVVLAGQ